MLASRNILMIKMCVNFEIKIYFLIKILFTTVKICKTMANVVLIVLKEGSESAVRCILSLGKRLPVEVVSAKSSLTGVIASKENPYNLKYFNKTKSDKYYF